MLVELHGGAETLGEIQGAGGGQQRRDPIAGHVAGGQGGLAGVLGDFQTVGIDGDVLGGGGKGHQHRQGDQPGQFGLRVAQRHAGQADGNQHLGQYQPGAAPAEPAEQRQAPLVEQWRPDPFEGVGQTDQAGETDGFARHPRFAQPHGKGGEHQHIGQAGGEPEEQQHQCGGAGIGGEGFAPAFTGH
ncbi:hypothetical protein D3C85_741780 [compost metagenome]